MIKSLLKLFLGIFIILIGVGGKGYDCKIAVVKYRGGGDWYANPTSLPNLVAYCNQNINTYINPKVDEVEIGSKEIFNYPYIHLTGHGNVVMNLSEKENLRTYLKSGGFLHIDDNYGMDPYIRPLLNELFPESSLIEISDDHPIYSSVYPFEYGMPKIHEHDGKAPEAFGIFHKGRLVVLYTYETDLGNGWEDQEVHNDPQEKRIEALKMGANIIQYIFIN